MQVAINLASRPYQDEGRFYRRWGTGLALLFVFTGFLIWASVSHYQSSQHDWASARQAQDKVDRLKTEAAQAQRVLAEPQNRGTRDRSAFLNAAILRKSFSWTHLMMDLEKVMPSGVRVVSIAPAVDEQSHFVLKFVVQGQTREGAVQLIRNMEKSQNFRSPELVSEAHAQGAQARGSQAGVRSSILAFYTPGGVTEAGD